MTALTLNTLYRIELCSGEICRWQYLGADAREQVWWRDADSGREFNESSLLYVWTILGREDAGG